MGDKKLKYPFVPTGKRQAPEKREVILYAQAAAHQGGTPLMPTAAKKFAERFSSTITRYPKQQELPNWLRAMIEKKVPVAELAKALNDRLLRAPTAANQELALLVANEIARMKGGPEVLARYATSGLLAKLSGKGGKEK